MKALFVFALFLLFVLPCASALESDLVSTVPVEKDYNCIYVNLPQDIGLTNIDSEAELYIEANKDESPWIDMTYNEIVMSPGVLNRNPVCFFHPEKSEGDFSFYRIRLTSSDLGVSNELKGGFCVSEYEDVDSASVENETDACELLNENADIFDLQFKEDLTKVSPGETVTKTIYMTSYANLRIELSLSTSLNSDFSKQTVTTSPGNPFVTKEFDVEVPESEGTYSLAISAKVVGCDMTMCRKSVGSVIEATGDTTRKGFSAKVIPENINLKEAKKTTFRLVIINYEEEKDFRVEVNPEPGITVSPKSATSSIGANSEKSLEFKITPPSAEPDLYKIDFNIKTSDSERVVTAYLSVGEILTGAKREAKETSDEYLDIKDQIQAAEERFEEKYNSVSYGDDLEHYEDFKEDVENAKKSAAPSEGTEQDQQETPPFAFDPIWLIIPVIIAAIILIFIAYKKSKVVSDTGGNYGDEGLYERSF